MNEDDTQSLIQLNVHFSYMRDGIEAIHKRLDTAPTQAQVESIREHANELEKKVDIIQAEMEKFIKVKNTGEVLQSLFKWVSVVSVGAAIVWGWFHK